MITKIKDTLEDALGWLLEKIGDFWEFITETLFALFMGIAGILVMGLVASSPFLILYIIFEIFFAK